MVDGVGIGVCMCARVYKCVCVSGCVRLCADIL